MWRDFGDFQVLAAGFPMYGPSRWAGRETEWREVSSVLVSAKSWEQAEEKDFGVTYVLAFSLL